MNSCQTIISSASPARNPASELLPAQQQQQTDTKESLHQLPIQRKLSVGAADDPLEKEADDMADKVMRMPMPEPISFSQPKNQVNRKCAHCEEEEKLQRKESNSESTSTAPPIVHDVLNSGGRSLDSETCSFMQSRFNYDFSNVKIHDNDLAAKSAGSMNALAYTSGSNVVFNAGQYNTNSDSGKRLLAHELTHVVQQRQEKTFIQRQHVPDTGWRYTPPPSVTRTIEEIQAIVGTTPDGVYGINTKNAVEKYQIKLKAIKLYNDTVDGKWGKNTEAAHVDFATGNEAETYNCSGLAFKTYIKTDITDTKSILATMNKLAVCGDKCKPHQHKFFFWEYDVSITDLNTGVTGPSHPDFHIVGGQTNAKGEGPSQVVSKNGQRPVEGPKPPLSWLPVSELARENNHGNKVVPDKFKNRVNHIETCFCSDKLP